MSKQCRASRAVNATIVAVAVLRTSNIPHPFSRQGVWYAPFPSPAAKQRLSRTMMTITTIGSSTHSVGVTITVITTTVRSGTLQHQRSYSHNTATHPHPLTHPAIHPHTHTHPHTLRPTHVPTHTPTHHIPTHPSTHSLHPKKNERTERTKS